MDSEEEEEFIGSKAEFCLEERIINCAVELMFNFERGGVLKSDLSLSHYMYLLQHSSDHVILISKNS